MPHRPALHAIRRAPEDRTTRSELSPHGGGAAPACHPRNPAFNIFYDAGTLIVICGKPMGPFVPADCIVEGHRGQVSVDSEPGCGTTFRFTVPVASLVQRSARPDHARETSLA